MQEYNIVLVGREGAPCFVGYLEGREGGGGVVGEGKLPGMVVDDVRSGRGTGVWGLGARETLLASCVCIDAGE
jgi:hypothetical protein